jgi:hypothetical protein
MFRDAQFSRCMASLNGITVRGSVICHDDTWRSVKCSQGAHCNRVSYEGMAMEHTHDEYWEMILTPGNTAWEYALRYPARHHPDESVFWLLEQRHREAGSVTLRHKCRSLTHCKDASQWRYHNCSCGTRAVEKRTLYHTKNGTIPTKELWSTSWRLVITSIPLLAVRVSRRPLFMDEIFRMATSTHCGWAVFT